MRILKMDIRVRKATYDMFNAIPEPLYRFEYTEALLKFIVTYLVT